MTPDQLRQLPPEQAMQVAAQDLSLPNDFFDRQWAQESDRGQNMRSPAGAQGHFGIMPGTQKAWEQRDGASYNPDDFYDGLYLAHATMQENLSKFKDPVDATRAYNSGWDPSRWNNPETNGYVQALWGGAPDSALPSLKRGAPAVTSILPSLKAGRPTAQPGVSGTPGYDALRNAAIDGTRPVGDSGIDAARLQGIEEEQAAAAVQARKDATGLGDVTSAALRDPRVMPTWSILDRFSDAPVADPNWDYMAHRDDLEAGRSDEEREYLRENAVSQDTANRAVAQLNYRRELDSTYADAGGYANFAGHMAAGLADPASLITGAAIGKGFQLARIGHAALAAEGSTGAALGALAAENAAANVAIEGISDVMGEHKTSADYVSAAATGVLFSGLFARGVFRQASEAHVAGLASDLRTRAADEQAGKVAQVMNEDPSLPPEQVGPRVAQRETEQVARAVDEATAPQRMDPVVPRDVQDEMVREFSGDVPDAAVPEGATDTAPTPEPVKSADERTDPDFADTVVEPTTWERLDQLRKGEVTRQVSDTTGGTIKLSWSADGNKLPKHGTLAEALTAVHMHPLATPADKRLATYLVKVMSADGLQAEIRFTARKGSSNFDPNGPGVAINDHGTGTAGAADRSSLVEQMQGLTKTGLYAVLHETVHVATYHRINAWESAAGKLRPEQQKIMSQFQDLFDRYRDEVQPLRDAGRNPNAGSLYAAKNLHEFAAQMMTDRETRFVLGQMPGKAIAGKSSNALLEFMSIIRRILGLGDKASAFDEGTKLLDQMIAMPVDNVRFANGKHVFAHVPIPQPATETPEFKRWFGHSVVTGPGGKPQVMYHGTNKTDAGEAFHMFDAYSSNHGLFGQGSYFTDNPEVASSYTAKGRGDSPTVYPVYLKVENPIDMAAKARAIPWENAFKDVDFEVNAPKGDTNEAYYRAVEEHFIDAGYPKYEAAEAIQDGLRSMGHDGITHIGGGRVKSDGVRHNVVIVFDPEQVKSATGNSGAFNPYKPGIVEAGPDTSGSATPIINQRARDTWADRMTNYAADYMRRNPIDMEKLKTLTMKIGGASDGLVLANSKNPIMQLVSSLVTETTTGAAGRKANVAIRSHMLTRKFVGNTLMDYDNAYTVWRGRNAGSITEDLFRGDKRRQFDKAVYEEVVKRRSADYRPNPDKAVGEAADTLEGLFDRSRVAQIQAGVLGHGNLPATSRGYIPQALDGAKLQAAPVKDLALLHEALANQFADRLGWDPQFARDFAPFYTERARRRAMGDKGLEGLGAGGEGLQLVRDTLEEMQADPSMVDRARAATSTMGQSHTKSRLDLDMLQELRPGLRMMDFYSTNPMILARSYAKRTAGNVALTEAGIHGIRGVRELEQASLRKQDGTQPTAPELGAYRRVMAEILGTPVATAVVSNGASNMGLLVGLQRLGGLVFTQAAETFNMIHHLGLRSLLSGVSELPRIMGEVGRLKRGAPSGNHILTSIEQYGGELGTEMYKMVAPLDAPDRMLSEYVDQPGLMTRLLRAGGHLQSKISGFRGVMAAQHRMVAEQIVMRAARLIRDGGDNIALRDMGFTPEVASSLKRDLSEVAKWDARDNLQEFDLTKVSDPRTAEAFVQAVHRGTNQIIQGTFTGERNKWVHNDYMKLLFQLRTFGLIATEKQWGRVRMNHGYAYAAGALLTHMALVLPIHFARIQLASIGRADRDQFIKDNLSPMALTKASMNYAGMSGMGADTLDILTGIAGGWGDSNTKDLLGGRNGTQATSVGKLIPAAASIDNALRAAGHHASLYTTLKQLPFSNLWYLLPAMNITKDH